MLTALPRHRPGFLAYLLGTGVLALLFAWLCSLELFSGASARYLIEKSQRTDVEIADLRVDVGFTPSASVYLGGLRVENATWAKAKGH